MQGEQVSYLKFVLMTFTAMGVMYGITYLNSYSALHIHWSETRLYMTCLMGSAMMVIMLSFMRRMYKNFVLNMGIFGVSAAVFLVAFWLMRSQVLVDDVSYMKAMIPHHSIAILTSERAKIKDPRVRKIADKIIEGQTREIREMEWLIKDIRSRGIAATKLEE